MISDSPLTPIGILSDKDLMGQIMKGKQKKVKSRDFEELAKELGI